MENYGTSTSDLDSLRLLLEAQDQNLQYLQSVLSRITSDDLDAVRKTLQERLRSLEALEQQLWAALFPACPPGYSAAHRMTMQPSRREYGGIW